MSRIANRLAQLKAEGRKALIPYVVAGDPRLSATVPTMHALVARGADIIELGVPFSDPMADGPVIQLGHERAMINKTSLRNVIQLVAQFREKDKGTPVVLMGYANPIVVMGYENFAQAAAEAGIDGTLTVDLPPEEALELNTQLERVGIDNIFLLAPTTTMERAAKICAMGSGFLYYVSLKGVTGAGILDIQSVTDKLAKIRELTDLPLCVGFGIKDPESACKLAAVSDGVVVGSSLVDKVAQMAQANAVDEDIAQAVAALIGDMREAMDA